MDKKTSVDSLFSAVKGIFYRLNLLEYGNNKISLTNLALLVCIVKISVSHEASVVELGALLLSLINYGHKRIESNKVIASKVESKEIPSGLSEEIRELRVKLAEQDKVMEEAKSFMVATKLSTGIKRQQL